MIIVFLKDTGDPAIGQTAVVEHLQQHVEDIWMGLLHLVEQDHGVRTTAHGLSELAALVVTHVSRGRTDQTLDAELLHVLGHVDTHERALVVEQALGKCLGELGLAHAGGARKKKLPMGLSGSERPARLRRTAAATAETASSWPMTRLCSSPSKPFSLSSSPCIILDTGTPVQALTTSAISSEVTCSLRPSPSFCFLCLERSLRNPESAAADPESRVAQLGRTAQVAVARRALLFASGLVELSLELLHVVDGVLLVEPAGLLHVELFLDLGDLLAQGLQTLLGGVVGLLHERLLLDLQLGELTRGGVNLDRHAVEFHAQAACGLIDQSMALSGRKRSAI